MAQADTDKHDSFVTDLGQSVTDSIVYRRDHTNRSAELKRRFVGPWFRESWGIGQKYHENHGFEFTTNMIPNLTMGRPTVVCRSDVADPTGEVDALQIALKSWMRARAFGDLLNKLATDTMFDFGFAAIELEAVPGYDPGASDTTVDDPRPMYLWPRVSRISPVRAIIDAQAVDYRHARLIGHTFIEDVQAMIDAKMPDGRSRFFAERVKAAGSAGVDETRREMLRDLGINCERGQIAGHEIYVRETGLIYTIAFETGNKAILLGEPRKPVCPASGPYVMFGAWDVPDQLYPLSHLAVTACLEEELNAHAAQASDEAGAAKRLVFVDGKQLAQTVSGTPTNGVIPVENFNNRVAEFRVSGASPEQLAYIENMRQTISRVSGLSDTVRGQITGATKGEVDTAQQNRNIRVRYCQENFRRQVGELLQKVAWIMLNSTNVRFPVTEEDEQSGESVHGYYQGGAAAMGDVQVDALQIEIDPYSGAYVDDAVMRQQAQTMFERTVESIPAMIQYPELNWRNLIEDLYKTHGIGGGSKRYIDWDMIRLKQRMANPQFFALVDAGITTPDPNLLASPSPTPEEGADGMPNLRLVGTGQAAGMPKPGDAATDPTQLRTAIGQSAARTGA